MTSCRFLFRISQGKQKEKKECFKKIFIHQIQNLKTAEDFVVRPLVLGKGFTHGFSSIKKKKNMQIINAENILGPTKQLTFRYDLVENGFTNLYKYL